MTKHIYHYNTHAEKRYFLSDYRNLYDMIALNGNIVSHTPAGIAGFISTAAKEFYIDPQTHAFQHATIHLKVKKSDNPTEYEFKPSVKQLAQQRLGSVFSSVISEDRPLKPEDFLNASKQPNASLIEEVSRNVGNFQQNILASELDDETKEFLGSSGFSPAFLVAPYFYLSSHKWREWLRINIACYEKTKELFSAHQVFLALILSKDVLPFVQEISTAISSVHPDGILLWIDEHDEEHLLCDEVKLYVSFLQGIRSCATTIYNTHGGYLSALLSHSGAGTLLNGVGHAINYGEHRSVVPIGGGIPMARFYFLAVHSRLRFADALGIVLSKKWLASTETYRDNICKCQQCYELLQKKTPETAFDSYGESNPITFTRKGSIVRLEYPTSAAKEYAIRHYLFCKDKEFRDIEKVEYDILVNSLKDRFNEIVNDYDSDAIAHLLCWHEALTQS